MKLLLDECIDQRFARELRGHDVTTVPQEGWAGLANGELLRRAAGRFDVFITVDWNLSFQQNVPTLDIAVVVLRAATNRLADLRPLAPKVLDALPTAKKGQVVLIAI